MAKKFLTGIDMAAEINLNQNELQNARIQNLATAPSNPVEGQIYMNTADHTFYVWNGSAWNTWGAAGGNAFGSIVVGSTTIAADNTSDTLTLTAGSNVTLTPDATNDSITIAATNTKNTAGSTNTTSKIYLVGPTSQTSNATTYSNQNVYVESNMLYSVGGINDVLIGAYDTGTSSPYIRIGNPQTIGTSLRIPAGDNTLDAAAFKAVGSVTDGNTGLVTGDDVYDAIQSAVSGLTGPMVFKGTLGTGGTITTLPTAAAANKGYTYKVITANTYASQAAKVGDLFISDGSSWILIPSGDEPSGTVTNIAVESPIITASGSAITSTGTIKHATSGPSSTASTSKGDTSNQTPGFGSTFKVTSGTVDKYGHTTTFAEHTVTIPNSTATTSAAGLMSATDKTNLDALASGNTVKVATGTISTSSTSVIIATGGNTSQIVAVTAHYTQQSSYVPVVVDWVQSTQTGAVTASISSTFSSALTVRVFYI